MIDIKKLTTTTSEYEYFKKGSMIFEDGDTSNNKMYILVEGSVDVYKNYEQPGEIHIATLTKGDFFGEMSLFLDKSRTATVIARQDIKVFVVERDGIFAFLKENAEAAFTLFQNFCTRIDNTSSNAASSSVLHRYEITALNSELVDLESIANTDALTGIYNRRFFVENAKSMLDIGAKMQTCSFLIMFDIEHFKQINDTYGHTIGDQVLIEFARRINTFVRAGDIFARYGGEEFILLLNYICQEDVVMLIEQLRKRILDVPIVCENIEINLSVSIGVAAVSGMEDINHGIARADQSLYRAKEEGRNKIDLNDTALTELRAHCESNRQKGYCSRFRNPR